jgi:DNA-binding response OmpR family regulator
MSEKILIVDDENEILEVIQAYLEKQKYIVYVAENGRTALQLFEKVAPDLIILDLMLPDISGEQICKEIRGKSNVPILMLTAKSNEDSKVNGLLIGADDYMTKPFSPRELTARVISLLRRTARSEDPGNMQLSFLNKRLVIDQERHEVLLNGSVLNLTALEFKLLMTIASRPKKVYSRLELINLIQGNVFEGYERTIDVHIKNLRNKLRDDPKSPTFIATVYGVGYKFLVDQDE